MNFGLVMLLLGETFADLRHIASVAEVSIPQYLVQDTILYAWSLGIHYSNVISNIGSQRWSFFLLSVV